MNDSAARKLSGDEVRQIALEARLVLTDDELAGAVRYINSFLNMLDRFKELDLKDVEPFCFAEVVACPLRDDTVNPFSVSGRDALLSGSDHVEHNEFRVPRIMED